MIEDLAANGIEREREREEGERARERNSQVVVSLDLTVTLFILLLFFQILDQMDVSRGITSRQLCSTLTKAQNMGSARHSLGRRFVINGRLHLFQPLAVKILAVLHPFVVQVLVQPRHAFSVSVHVASGPL